MQTTKLRRILIVDDHYIFRTVLSDLLALAQPGARILQARDGKEGVDLALAEKPDLILMDVHMPVMDGYEATKALREKPETKSIPVIAMFNGSSGNLNNLDSPPVYNAFVSKPFYIDELMQIITQINETGTGERII